MIDTHVHFGHLESADGVAGVLARAAAAGVRRMVAIGGNPAENARAVALAREHPDRLRAAVGFDRESASRAVSSEELAALAGAADGVVTAVGEIGLDFHYHPENKAAQLELFERQLALARERRLPVVVHVREAEAEALAALARHAAVGPGDPARLGVIHCFTGTRESAPRFLELGLYISFSGIVTFRNADPLREAARVVPADRLLIETDSPFLAPAPHRGKPNEPAFLPAVAECLARVRGCTVEEVAAVTTRNAERLFGWV